MFNPLKPENRALLMAAIRRVAPLLLGALAISVLFWWLGPTGEGIWGAPLLLLAGMWLMRFGLKDRKDQRALEARLRGQAPRPGQWVAACGTATALDDPAGPGLGTILAYRFRTFDRANIAFGQGSTRNRQLELRYDAFYLAPTGIADETGTVRLASIPDMVHTDKRGLNNDQLLRAKARAELQPTGLPAFAAREKLLAEPVETLDACLKFGDWDDAGEGRTDCWLLRAGEQVCVFGVWDQGRLLRDPARPRGLPLYLGSAQEVYDRLKGDSSAFVIVAWVVLALALAWGVWALL